MSHESDLEALDRRVSEVQALQVGLNRQLQALAFEQRVLFRQLEAQLTKPPVVIDDVSLLQALHDAQEAEGIGEGSLPDE